MRLRHAFGVLLGHALLLGGNAGCDVGNTNIFFEEPNRGGSGGSANAGTGSGGSAPIAPGGPCTTSAECKDQVCSPGGTCVDCNQDQDCLSQQYCEQTRCIASGNRGGAGSGGGGGGGGGSGGAMGCSGAQVLFVVQRSGIMFEQPNEGDNYWTMVRDAVSGDNAALSPYFDKVAVGALFFVRVPNEECPLLSRAQPALSAMKELGELFTSNATDYQALADAQSKMDAPVPEALAAAAMSLSGTARHVVLITTGVADTCSETDNPCLMDPSIKAVQDAQKAGITTHVIGMGDTGLLDTGNDQDGYQTYLKQLANAGAGKSVKKSAAFDEKCSDDKARATYSNDDGDAKAYRAESTSDVKAAVAEIFKSICP
jgi:hypothetical protein